MALFVNDDRIGARRARRRWLAGAAPLALALALIPAPAMGQAFQGTGNVVGGVNATIATGPGQTTIFVNAPEAIINWSANGTNGSTAPIDFLPAGTTATFTANPQFNITGFTVLNRILPTDPATGLATNQPIAFNGTVESVVGRLAGGNIWFYSPGGLIVGATGVFNVGGLVLTTNDIDTAGGLFGPGNAIRFGTGTPNPAGAVQINAGARINAGSYLAVVAPRVVQAGTVTVDGSTAYVAAERATIAINAGLFDIDIAVGSADPNGIVHSGTTTGPATTGAADAQRVYLVGLAKNDALTMLLSGTIGYTAAAIAANEAGAVILSAGGGVAGGNAVAPTAPPATRSGATISNARFLSRLAGFTSGDTAITAATGAQNVRFDATVDLIARTRIDLSASNGGQISSGGGVTLSTAPAPMGGAITVAARGAQSAVTIGGQLALNAIGSDPGFVLATGRDTMGGTIDLLADGGAITANALVANASALAGFGFTQDGTATGGAVTLTARGGGTATFAATTLRADASPPDSRPSQNPAIGAGAIGGRVTVTAAGGTLALGAPTLSATARGGFGTQRSGDAVGGSIALGVSNAALTWTSLSAQVDALTSGAPAGGAFGSVRGSATGIQLDIGAGGALTVTNGVTLSARGTSSGGNGAGSTAQAGVIGVTARDGGRLTSGGMVITANAEANKTDSSSDTGAPQTAIGGAVTLDANGGTIAANSFVIGASGTAGGSRNGNALGRGGTITLGARGGGTLSATLIGGANGITADGNGLGGEHAINGTGGTLLLYAEDGTLSFAGPLLASASGFASDGVIAGASGGTGTGGTITIETRPGAQRSGALRFTTLTLNADGSVGQLNAGAIGSRGSGGAARGGTVMLDLPAGAFTANMLRATANATGGAANSGFNGGDALGGVVQLMLSGGTMTVPTVSLIAEAVGGTTIAANSAGMPPSRAGNGTGGAVSLAATAGTLTSDTLTLSANGTGGTGRLTSGFPPPSGGAGTGGTALLSLGAGGTARLALGTLAITANGLGGNGGALVPAQSVATFGDRGGDGGAGTGGAARLLIAGGTLEAVGTTLAADGRG
ncbi:MAG: hypothetical protein K2X76_00195, partial [Sphingomonas sp.]|nr:hypothetical protein [Sphingomonas sp.]